MVRQYQHGIQDLSNRLKNQRIQLVYDTLLVPTPLIRHWESRSLVNAERTLALLHVSGGIGRMAGQDFASQILGMRRSLHLGKPSSQRAREGNGGRSAANFGCIFRGAVTVSLRRLKSCAQK